jgi:hypothetical protein
MEANMKLYDKSNMLIAGIMLFGLCACNASVATPTATLTPILPTATQPAFNPTPTFVPVIITPSPLPTQPIIPVITPDAIQMERWKEYQTELAKLVHSEAGYIFPDYESALCEWDILGRSDREVYLWAMCFAPNSGDRKPAVIHLNIDGSIQKVEVPFHGSSWESTIQKLFPVDIQEKINAYFYSSATNSGRAEELRTHLLYRLTHPEEPPLIIRSATTSLSPTVEPTSTEWLPYNPNISDEGCGEFIATLSIEGTEGWSEEKIGRKLFEIYLEHFKSPSLGGRCRLENFIIEDAKFDQIVAFLTKDQKMDFTVNVLYSIQIQEVPSDWLAGNGELAKDGWIIHKYLIIGAIKDNNQYILHLIGTGP